MIPIIPTIIATKAGLDILQKAKSWFYPNQSISEAEALLSKRVVEDVGSLQLQVEAHRQVMDKLVAQVKADKDLIEKHNEILIQLSENMQQIADVLAKVRIVSFWAMGLAGGSILLAILLKILK